MDRPWCARGFGYSLGGTWVRIPETEGRSASAAEVDVSQSAETQDYTKKPLAQKYWEEEGHGNLEELAYVPSASRVAALGYKQRRHVSRASGGGYHRRRIAADDQSVQELLQ